MEDWRYNKARRRVKKVKGFYVHLSSWLIFTVFFLFMNFSGGRSSFRTIFPLFPVLAWGVGVLFHAIGVFGIPGLGKDWEDRMIDREMDRIDREDQLEDWHPDSDALDSPSSHEYTEEEPPLRLKKLRKDPRDSDFV
ncbi:MAG: hypothetical protein DRI69_01600 [Bacteroidetes bacterium]|nr:MAG: hypothetical protein DRI69_01600 [Bacteroidota bacterium]